MEEQSRRLAGGGRSQALRTIVKTIRILCLLALGTLAAAARADWPSGVTVFEAARGKTVEVRGAFEQGATLDDLSWAWSSTNACFPGTQGGKFVGHHVFFATKIPPRSVMTITVIPDDKEQDVSIYAYMIGTTYFDLPPSLSGCVTCEADHKWDRPWRGKTQDHTRSVEVNAIGNPYNVVIGVSGPASAVKGSFSLQVNVK